MPELAVFAESLVVTGMKERRQEPHGFWPEDDKTEFPFIIWGRLSGLRCFSVGLCWLGPIRSCPALSSAWQAVSLPPNSPRGNREIHT